MAAWLDGVKFNPTLGGTTDFVVSTAAAGCNTPAQANAVNATVYKWRAESADLSQWEDFEGAYTVGSTTVARTTVLYNSSQTGTKSPGQSGAGTKINFTTVPTVSCIGIKEDLISIEEANSFTATQKAQIQNNIAVPMTTQFITSGTTYTTGVQNGQRASRIKVLYTGGGGGGAGVPATAAVTIAGSDGTKSTFNSVDAAPGKGAAASTGAVLPGAGGAGGAAGAGTATLRMPGQPGTSACSTNTASVAAEASTGGSTLAFGGGAPAASSFTTAVGNVGAANSGGGGSGAVNVATNNNFGASGGGAESVLLIINSPAASYTIAVGAGGAGGVSTTNGGAGANGGFYVEEYYGA